MQRFKEMVIDAHHPQDDAFLPFDASGSLYGVIKRFRRSRMVLALALTAAVAGGATALVSGPSSPYSNISAGQNAHSDNQDQGAVPPEAFPSGGAEQLFEPEPTHIDVTFEGIPTPDGCVTHVAKFKDQKIQTESIDNFTRELTVSDLEITSTTCIDDDAKVTKQEGPLDEERNLYPLIVGLDASSIRVSSAITKADITFNVVAPGKQLSPAGCKQVALPGCPQNPNAPKGTKLDPTLQKAVAATLEAMAAAQVQKMCAKDMYAGAVKKAGESMFEQLDENNIPRDALTYQLVDSKNNLFGLVPKYMVGVNEKIANAGGTKKAVKQKAIFGDEKLELETCGATNA